MKIGGCGVGKDIVDRFHDSGNDGIVKQCGGMRKQTHFTRFIMVMVVVEFVRYGGEKGKNKKECKPFTETAQILFPFQNKWGMIAAGR